MKRLIFLLLTGLQAFVSQAQLHTAIIRVKSESGKLLPFVAVGIPGTSIGTMTDEQGMAQLFSETAINLVRASCIGYKSLEFQPFKFPDTVEITLKEVRYELPVATIKAGKLKKITFGLEKERTKLYTNFAIQGKPRQNLGAAMGKIIDFGKESHCLDRFRVFLATCTFDTIWLRLNIYEAEEHEPGAPLIQEGILIPVVGVRSGWVNVSLANRQLCVSGTVFFSLEWVGYSGKTGFLSVPLSMPRPFSNHYYRYGSQNNWKRHRLMSTSMVIDAWKSDE